MFVFSDNVLRYREHWLDPGSRKVPALAWRNVDRSAAQISTLYFNSKISEILSSIMYTQTRLLPIARCLWGFAKAGSPLNCHVRRLCCRLASIRCDFLFRLLGLLPPLQVHPAIAGLLAYELPAAYKPHTPDIN